MRLISLLLLTVTLGCDGDRSKSDKASPDLSTEDQGAETGGNPQPAAPTNGTPAPLPEVPVPGTEEVLVELDARSSTESVYLKLDNGALVKTTSDQPWLFAVKRTQFQSNSGTSGTLNFGVMSLETTDYDSVTSCQVGTLTYDEMLPASGAPGSLPYSGNAVLNSWYNYDMTTHVISSKKLVYLITDGSTCIKFQIVSYSSGVYEVLADTLEIPRVPEPEVHEQTIDASSSTDTVYLKLDQGQLVSTTSDQPWLFAVKRTQFQTNSGTSGTRGVGVHDSGSTDFAALSSCENLTFTYDEMLPASGAPGSQPYSGNAILNAWYDYDMTTHTLNSKQLLYLLSDGTECLKFQILSYASGVYSVKVSQL
jgi:hypothetical protein